MSKSHWVERADGAWLRDDGLRVFYSYVDAGWRVNGIRASVLGFDVPRTTEAYITAGAAMAAADRDYPMPPSAQEYVEAQRARDAYPEHTIRVEDMPKHDCGGQPVYPDDNPKTMYGDRKAPIHLVPPTLLVSVAGVFKLGAQKYGPYNWRDKTVSSSVYQGAMLRHLMAWWDGETIDPESGESHLAHVAACAGILLDAAANEKLNDDRPTAGRAGELIRAVEEDAA